MPDDDLILSGGGDATSAGLGIDDDLIVSGSGDTDADPPPASCGTVNVLARGMSWLSTTLPRVAGEPVVYGRGPLKVSVCATFGTTLLKLSDGEGGVRVERTDRDFLIPAASLKIGGVPTLPKRGDVVRHDDGLSVHVYEVLPYGDEPHWRWCDPYRKLIRVHTKHVSSGPA